MTGADAGDRWLDGERDPDVLRFGSWRLAVTVDSVDDITFAGIPVLRAVRWVVRDADWRTVPLVLTHRMLSTPDLGATGQHDQLVLAVEGRSVDPAVAVELTGRLILRAGSVRYEMTGRVAQPFRRNRFGLVVLHPPAWAGTPVTVLHPDGDATDIVVPSAIAPHQPARDIAGLRWRVGPVAVDLAVEGDVFETEDQRNWTDASFKTYSTPLARPFPVEIGPQDAVTQAVEVRCTADEPVRDPAQPAGGSDESRRSGAFASWVFPEIALGASTCPDDQVGTGSVVAVPTVLVELDLDAANWRPALARAAREAERLDVRLVCGDPRPIADAVRLLAGYPVVRLGVVDRATHVSEPQLVAALVDALDALDALPGAGAWAPDVVLGTRAHFTELNRTAQRLGLGRHLGRDLALRPGVVFSLTPQMHDRSRRQVVESLGVQRRVADQAVRLAAGAAVHVGPITLRPRFNAVATSPPPPDPAPDLRGGYNAEHVPDATDPRQASAGAAAWTVATAVALAVPGVASLTFFETSGPRGVTTATGDLLPAGHAVGWLAGVAGGRVLASASPTDVASIVVESAEALTVLAANLSARPRDIEIAIPPGPAGTLTDESGALSRLGDRDGVLTVTVPAAGAVRWTRPVPDGDGAGTSPRDGAAGTGDR